MKRSRVLSVCMAVAVLAGSMGFVPARAAAAEGNTYYVDAAGGNDGNNGHSAATAWKSLSKVNTTTFLPGDKLLFRAGGVWHGELHPLGSGTAGSPVIIDMYDSGRKPLISGDGGTNALRLVDQEYWEISHLEITNSGAGAATRRGVSIEGKTETTLNHIYLRELDIHDVQGIVSGSGSKKNGAIVVWGANQASTSTSVSRYNDLRIEGNHIHHVDRVGMNICEDTSLSQLSSNVVIRGNILNDCGGDGVIINMCQSPLIEHNTAMNVNSRSGVTACAIWPWNCNDAVFQFNEAYGTKTSGSGDDGTAWDADAICRGTVYQYNYSHDNYGGALLVCATDSVRSEDAVFRYNISQNEKNRIIYVCGPSVRTSIYNNVFYSDASVTSGNVFYFVGNAAWHDGMTITNNIFDIQGGMAYTFGQSENNVFDHNVFYGNHPASEPADAHKLTTDPKFVAPGTGGFGIGSVDGYKLQADSPCVDAGAEVPDNGGRDYWGNAVPSGGATDIGAFELINTAAVPTGLTAQSVSEQEVDIRWNALADTIYDLQIDGVTYAGAVSPYVHLGVQPGFEHTYRVRSANASGVSGWSDAVTAKTVTGAFNKLSNPGFELGDTGWTNNKGSVSVSDPAAAHSGNFARSLAAAGASCEQKVFNVEPGKGYTLSGWGKVAAAGGEVDVGVDELDSTGQKLTKAAEIDFKGTAYEQQSRTLTVTDPHTTQLLVWIWKDNDNTGAWVDDMSLTALDSIATPQGLKGTLVSDTQVNVEWNMSAGATAYDIEVDGTVTKGVTSPYVISGLTAGTSHQFRVKARNAADASDWTDMTVMATTQNLILNPGFENTPVRWDDYGGTIADTAEAHSGSKASVITRSTGASQVIENIIPGEKYVFSAWGKTDGTENMLPSDVGVKCKDANGDTISGTVRELNFSTAGFQQKLVEFTPPAGTASVEVYIYKEDAVGTIWTDDLSLVRVPSASVALGIPSGLKTVTVSDSEIKVSWDGTSGATGYDLEADGHTIPAVTSPWVQRGLGASTLHSYRVRARNDSGTGEWSATVTGVTGTANLVPDAGFESGGLDVWSHDLDYNKTTDPDFVTVVSGEAHSGSHALRTGKPQIDGGQAVWIPVTGADNKKYALSGWVRFNDAFGGGTFGIDCFDKDNKKILHKAIEISGSGSGLTYQQFVTEFTAAAGTAYFQIFTYMCGGGSDTTGYEYLDDVSLTEVAVPENPVPLPGFILSGGSLTRNGGMTAQITVTPGAGHTGTETLVFELMKGTEPVTMVAVTRDILSQETMSAYFNVAASDQYTVKVFVLDAFSSDPAAPQSLADPVTLKQPM